MKELGSRGWSISRIIGEFSGRAKNDVQNTVEKFGMGQDVVMRGQDGNTIITSRQKADDLLDRGTTMVTPRSNVE